MQHKALVSGAGEQGHRTGKRRRMAFLSFSITLASLTSLFVGGSRQSSSTLGIALVILGVLGLAASVLILVITRSAE